MTDKGKFTWCLVSLGLLFVAHNYLAIWVLVTRFAAGLGWPSDLLLGISGPIAAVGAALGLRQPRQPVAIAFGTIAFFGWVLLWVLMFTLLGFRFS